MLKLGVDLYNFMPVVFILLTFLSASVVIYVIFARLGVAQKLVSVDTVALPKKTNKWLTFVSVLTLILSLSLIGYARAHTKYNVIVRNETKVSYQLKHLSHAYATSKNNTFTVELPSGAVVTYKLKNSETMKIVPYYNK